MAWDTPTMKISLVAGSTFNSSDLYKGIALDTDGNAILASAGSTEPNVIGTLYSYTKTTTTDAEAVTVAIGPVVKARATGTTVSQGDLCEFSTAAGGGLIAASTNLESTRWLIIDGTSGAAARVVTALRMR